MITLLNLDNNIKQLIFKFISKDLENTEITINIYKYNNEINHYNVPKYDYSYNYNYKESIGLFKENVDNIIDYIANFILNKIKIYYNNNLNIIKENELLDYSNSLIFDYIDYEEYL